MEKVVKKDFSQKKGVISNTHGFLSVYLDGGFKEKWSGYWSPSHKYLDYFAAKTNGEWLTEKNLTQTKYGEKITQTHQTSNLEIKQEITCPVNTPGFKIKYTIKNNSKEKKAVKTSLETGIDIRPRTEDIGGQNYNINSREIGIKVDNNGKWISLSGKKFKFEEQSHIKEHYPGEKQKCVIPGKIHWKTELKSGEEEEASILFKTDGGSQTNVEKPIAELKSRKLGDTFEDCCSSLENLYYGKNKSGIIAGHPWFQNYWARDSFWTALGMIDAGMFEEVEKMLLNFAEREVPSMIRTDGTTETEYPRSDTIPLYALAAEKLERHYKPNPKIMETAEKLLEKQKPEEKIVDNHEDGTWMDTLKRKKAVEIQSLWIEALKKHGKNTQKLEKGLEKFKKQIYLKDNLENDFESINPAIPIMFNQTNSDETKKYLEKINAEFSSTYGARTRSATDPGYHSSGYHTGSVWGLTTCWAAAANLRHGNKKQGINFLEKMTQFTCRNQLGALPELVDAETGESLGCSEQAWSAGMFIHTIDTYLLGIKVENTEKIKIQPVEGINMTRKNKKIGDKKIDIHVEDGKINIPDKKGIKVEEKTKC